MANIDVCFRVPLKKMSPRQAQIFLTDLLNLPTWDSTVKHVTRVGPNTFDVTVGLHSLLPRVTVRYSVEQHFNWCKFYGRHTNMNSVERLVFLPKELTYTSTIKLSGVGCCFAPLLARNVRTAYARAEKSLRDIL